jgi:hypothetical protein
MVLRLSLCAGSLLVSHAIAFAFEAQAPTIIGESVEIRSSVLNESRMLFISKPFGYDKANDRYPVLYVLDGELHFQYVAPMVRFLAANDRIPDLIVVGIASGTTAQRTRDLTPLSSVDMDRRFFLATAALLHSCLSSSASLSRMLSERIGPDHTGSSSAIRLEACSP